MQDKQLSHKKQRRSRDDTDARLQTLVEEWHSLQAALWQPEAKVQTRRLGRTPTPGAAQTAPLVGPETAHAPAASAVMRPVQQDPAMGAVATHVAIMDSTPAADVVQMAPQTTNPCAQQRHPRTHRRTKLRRLCRLRKRPDFSLLWRHRNRPLRQPRRSYRRRPRLHFHVSLKQQRGQRHGEAQQALRMCWQRLEVCRQQLAPNGDRLAFHCSNTGILAPSAVEMRAEGTQTYTTQQLDMAPMHAHPDEASDTMFGRACTV